MSMRESNSLHPLLMQTEASNGASDLEASEKLSNNMGGSATKLRDIYANKQKTKLMSPIPSYQTDRYRLASPHGYKV